jgi:hypothetical protein
LKIQDFYLRAWFMHSQLFHINLRLNGKDMNPVQKFLSAAGAAAMFVLSSGASAAPVSFTITAAQFLPGPGYGIDLDEASPNLLDVRFSTSVFSTQNFALSAVNQSNTFNFGTIDLEEASAHSGIQGPEELDGLLITAKLTFTAPTGVTQTISATGVATPGSVSDSQVDYVIDWAPVLVSFGNGGQFRISLTDMAFSDMGAQFQTATVTLLSLSDELLQANDVPEPATVALLGIGIGSVAVVRRRRAKA